MSSNFDRAVGIVGLLVAIATFVAQGPYEAAWQYTLPFAPIALAAVAIGVHNALPRLRNARNLYEYTRPIAATRVRSSLTIQVNNAAGDATLTRWYKLEVVKNGVEISNGKKEVLVSKTTIPGLPPQAILRSSSNVRHTLVPSVVDQSRIEVAGRPLWRYVWHYQIDPPLTGKGAFLEYTYAVDVPVAEAAAFSADGSLFSVEHGAINMQVVDAKLIAPAHHSIEVMECYLEHRNGNQQALPDGEGPVLTDSGELLSWNPTFRKGSRYVCRYRMVDHRIRHATAGAAENARTATS